MSLKELLEKITHGNVSDENLRLLASRLSRISHKCEEKDREKFYLSNTYQYGVYCIKHL